MSEETAGPGHNNPPEPTTEPAKQDRAAAIREIGAGVMQAAQMVTKAGPVEDDEQLKVADDVLASVKEFEKQVKEKKEEIWRPLKNAADQAAADFAPLLKSIEATKKAIAGKVSDYKAAKAKESAAAQEKAKAELDAALKLKEEAEKAAEETGDLAAIEAAEAAKVQAKAARKSISAAKKEKPKGMRTVEIVVLKDPRAALNYLARTDPETLKALLTSWAEEVRKLDEAAFNDIPGVEIEVKQVTQGAG